jgi:hypothetical protein
MPINDYNQTMKKTFEHSLSHQSSTSSIQSIHNLSENNKTTKEDTEPNEKVNIVKRNICYYKKK